MARRSKKNGRRSSGGSNSSLKDELRALVGGAATDEEIGQVAARLDTMGAPTDKPPGDYTVRTLGEVAVFFGLAVSTVKAWRMGENPMPGQPGGYQLDLIAQWRLKAAGVSVGGADPLRQKLERELIEIRIKKLRDEQEVARGKLMEREEVARDVRRWLTALRSTLLTVGRSISTLVGSDQKATAKKLAEDIVWRALEEARHAMVSGESVDDLTKGTV